VYSESTQEGRNIDFAGICDEHWDQRDASRVNTTAVSLGEVSECSNSQEALSAKNVQKGSL
jgi:hypothetical protein